MSLLAGGNFARSHAQTLAGPAAPPAALGDWREAPEYVSLFAPRIYRDAYRTFTSSADIGAALRLIAADAGGQVEAPGAWATRFEHPFDAFGTGGTYDRWKVARLYGSRRLAVARGPRGHDGFVDESWTLVSPYPSADLARVEPGTLLIVVRVP